MITALPARWSKSLRVFVAAIVLLSLVGTFFILPAKPADACLGGGWLSKIATVATGFIGCAVGAGFNYVKDKAGDAALALVELVLKFILTLITWLARAMAGFFTFVLYRLSPGVGFIGNDMVQAGWAVVRDISNWFFVIFFLVSAVSTILNIQRYNARAILPKLIIIAILINFSLFIGGFVINVSQGITWIFTNQIAAAHDDIGLYLVNNMGITSLADPYSGNVASDLEGGDNAGAKFANLGIAIIFMSVAAFVFAALGLMFLIRIVYLWVLLILAPLAFVLSIWPSTQEYFQKWVKNLVHWSFFAPIAAFFIWLSTYLVVYMNNLAAGGVTANWDFGTGASVAIITVADSLFRFITVIVFLLMALKASTSLTGALGNAAANVAKKGMVGVGLMGGIAATRKGAQLAGRGAKAGARQAYRRAPGERQPLAVGFNQALANSRFRTLSRLGKRGLDKQQAYTGERSKKAEEKDASSLPRDQHGGVAQAAANRRADIPITDVDARDVGTALRRGINIDISTEKLQQVVGRLRRIDNDLADDVVASRLDLAGQAGLIEGQDGPTDDPEQIQLAAQNFLNSAAGRRRGHLINERSITDVEGDDEHNARAEAVRNAVIISVAQGHQNPNQLQRRMEQGENYEGYHAFQQLMRDRFIDQDTNQVRGTIDVNITQPDGTVERTAIDTQRPIYRYFDSPIHQATDAPPDNTPDPGEDPE